MLVRASPDKCTTELARPETCIGSRLANISARFWKWSLLKSIIFIIPHHRKSSLSKQYHSHYRKNTVLEIIIFLTFDINEIDAFQKAIVFEESEKLPGVKTFGGVQKVYVLKHILSGNQSKSIWISNVLEQESIWIPHDFKRLSKCTF